MIALSLALSFLGSLAFAAFVLWLRRDQRLASDVRSLLGAATEFDAKIARFEKALENIPERVGKLEMALNVRRVG